jgi:hypothetical protein
VNAFLHIELSELADQQIKEADAWWRANRQKAPNAIREELERVSSLIAFHPHIGVLPATSACLVFVEFISSVSTLTCITE